MKLNRKIRKNLLVFSSGFLPVVFALSATTCAKPEQKTSGPSLPGKSTTSFDYSLRQNGSSDNYRIDYNRDALNAYINYGSESISDQNQRNSYISKRRNEYITAWRAAFEQQAKELQTKFSQEYSSKLEFQNLDTFSVSSENIKDFQKEIQIDFYGKKATLKFVQLSHVIENTDYVTPKLPQAKRDSLTNELENANSVGIVVKLSYEMFLDDKKITNIGLTLEKNANISLAKTIGQAYKELTANLSDLPKLNIDWNNQTVKAKYFDAYLSGTSDGDTITVTARTALDSQNIKVGDTVKIRLAGIDTPEKAVSSELSAPLENSFAVISSKFAKDVLEQTTSAGKVVKQNLRIGFVEGKDGYGRVLADVFFGDNYEYSYNTSIVSQGYTLPYINGFGWVNKINEANTYENVLYPYMYDAFNKAIENKKGFFRFFNSPEDVQKFVYLIKPNNEWRPFWSQTEDNVLTKITKN